jgi:hypothetical protein
MHTMELLGDVGHVESYCGLFGDTDKLTLDSCTVCAERTKGLEIIMDTPDGTAR